MHAFITPRGAREADRPPRSCPTPVSERSDPVMIHFALGGSSVRVGESERCGRRSLTSIKESLHFLSGFLQRYNTCLGVSGSRSNSGYVLSAVANPPHPALGSPQSAEWFEFRKWQIPLDSQQSALCSCPTSPGLSFSFFNSSFPPHWMTGKVTCFCGCRAEIWTTSNHKSLFCLWNTKTGQRRFELRFDNLSVCVWWICSRRLALIQKAGYGIVYILYRTQNRKWPYCEHFFQLKLQKILFVEDDITSFLLIRHKFFKK